MTRGRTTGRYAPLYSWCLIDVGFCGLPARRHLPLAVNTHHVTIDTHAQGMEARGQRRMNRGTRRKELLALRALLGLGASSGDGGGAEGEGGGAGRPGLGASSSHSQQQDGVGSKLLYDRVLVDSDCTHDGSARHLAKVAGLEEWVYVHAICVDVCTGWYGDAVCVLLACLKGVATSPVLNGSICNATHITTGRRARADSSPARSWRAWRRSSGGSSGRYLYVNGPGGTITTTSHPYHERAKKGPLAR